MKLINRGGTRESAMSQLTESSARALWQAWRVHRDVYMPARNGTSRPAAKNGRSDPGISYDEFKEYGGKRYSGMKVGRSHKWYYDQGEWKEKKITPDLWQISYAVTKRRAGRAPEGSGVPVGTEYHWYIVAHQNVTKLNANDYTTSLAGLKFKVAHKRAGMEKWSATPKAQRKRIVQFLKQLIEEIGSAPEQVEPEADSSKSRPGKKRLAHPPSMAKPSRRRSKSGRS
jgi:hypothetical protein